MNNLVDGMHSLVVGMERLGIQWAGGEAMVSLARDMMGISHRLEWSWSIQHTVVQSIEL